MKYIFILLFFLFLPLSQKVYAVDQYTQGKTEFLPQENGTFNVIFSWTEVNSQDINGYSLAISNYPGADPGPSIDTYSDSWTFSNINSGIQYINIKHRSTYGWSRIWYWKIIVPAWIAPATSTLNTTNDQVDSTTSSNISPYFILTLGLSIFLISSLIIMNKYKKIRKIVRELNEKIKKAQATDDKYLYIILPPIKPLIEKPRKVNYSRYRYRRRYY